MAKRTKGGNLPMTFERSDTIAEAPAPRTGGQLSKSEAIRQAFEHLGWDAKPSEIVAALEAKGYTVSPNLVSLLKNKRRKKESSPSSSSSPRSSRRQPMSVQPSVTSSAEGELAATEFICLVKLVRKAGGIENVQGLMREYDSIQQLDEGD